jgi:hypothetical protein
MVESLVSKAAGELDRAIGKAFDEATRAAARAVANGGGATAPPPLASALSRAIAFVPARTPSGVVADEMGCSVEDARQMLDQGVVPSPDMGDDDVPGETTSLLGRASSTPLLRGTTYDSSSLSRPSLSRPSAPCPSDGEQPPSADDYDDESEVEFSTPPPLLTVVGTAYVDGVPRAAEPGGECTTAASTVPLASVPPPVFPAYRAYTGEPASRSRSEELADRMGVSLEDARALIDQNIVPKDDAGDDDEDAYL